MYEHDGQIQMSSIGKEVFNQLNSTRTLHKIINDTNVLFTSVKHDFNICRKSFIKLYARYFFVSKNETGLVDVYHKTKQYSGGFVMMKHFKDKNCFTNSLFLAPRGPATNILKGLCNLKILSSIMGTLVPQILS